MIDVRSNIVAWAKWAAAHHEKFNYTQGPNRMSNIGKPGLLPVYADCSSFVTLCYNWAGAPDPNGMSYNHTGYTGTLLAHGQKIALKDVQPGDVIVYGGGTGEHTALIVGVDGNNNPLTISHGQQGDPSYIHVNQDGRKPQTYLRFNTIATSERNVHVPPVSKK
jgi:cell wall-associated NlpC family hydrolase